MPSYVLLVSVTELSYAQSCLTLCDPWTVAHRDSLSMGFSWNTGVGLPFPPSGDLSDPGIEPASPSTHALQESF